MDQNQNEKNTFSPENVPATPAPEAPARPEPAAQPAQPAYFATASGPSAGMPTPPPKKKKNRGLVIVAVIVGVYLIAVTAVLGLIISGAIHYAVDEPSSVETTEEKESDKKDNPPIKENPSTDGAHTIVGEDYSGEALSAATLYENNVDCVVFVEAIYARGSATGSGFVIDAENGYLLTNYHVVEDCNDIAVTFVSGDSYTAKLVGGDEINDVAVLKIEAKDLKNVTVGNSDNVKVGDDVLVIGNPLGDLTFTLTKGIVSGTEREINTGEYTINTFQTDAAINSGNSGGPAFDATGAVIGIASAKYAATGVEGIGFCIPINDAMAIAKDLVEHGYVTGRPNFGITVSDSTGFEYTTDEWGRRHIVETMPGAKVEEVGKDSCAEKAGLKVGDIIIKINDKTVETASELINAKNAYKAGDEVLLEVYRDGKTVKMKVTLDEYTP